MLGFLVLSTMKSELGIYTGAKRVVHSRVHGQTIS